MSTGRTDPDFSDRPKSDEAVDRPRRFLGMRPAFARVATPVLVAVSLAAASLEGAGWPSASPPPTSLRPRVQPLFGTIPGPLPAVPAPIDLPMIVPDRPGIDEAMIHQARQDVDPRMIVPAFAAPAVLHPLAAEPPAIVPLRP